jgi:AraC-like DNA-binding protein
MIIGDDRVALCGRLREIGTHRHAAAAVVVGMDGPLRFVAERTHESGAVLLAPGFAHAVDVRGGRIAVFLLPPHAVSAAGLLPLRDLAQPQRWRELGQALLDDALDDFAVVDRCLARDGQPPRPVDERLQRATAAIASTLGENQPIEAIAADVGLSASRLMALAREQLGTSLRTHRRWLRMFSVVRDYAAGASLTEAAHAAGFASSAHLSAASREALGIRPSQVLTGATRPGIVHLA